MNICITDGGRTSEGYSNEVRDCAVRALATALDIPYYQSHQIFQWGGRRNRCKSYHTRETLKSIDVTGQFCRISLSNFIKLNPIGTFYVLKRGHAFTLKDGVVFDKSKLSGRVIVRWFAKIK